MKSIVVLAMHGMTPKDFPLEEKKEFLRLHSQTDSGGLSPELKKRHDEMDAKIRRWPRTPQNDAFHTAAVQLAKDLESSSGSEVILGYNEFCAPSLPEAFDLAAARRPDRVIVVTPMMTRGGNHSENEIPAEVEAARKRFPQICFDYAWPFNSAKTAQFLAQHILETTHQSLRVP